MSVHNTLPRCLLFALLCISSADSGSQSVSITIVIGRKITIPSTALNEERAISVHTPQAYNQDSLRCPVLYLFDGQWHFRHVVSTVEYLLQRGKIPPVIVVAIPGTDRPKDFTPLRRSGDGRAQRAGDSSVSGNDGFFRFLREELIPYVDRNYRTHPFRILAGHSLGAMFATSVLPEASDLFNAYILIGAAFYGENLAVVESLGPFLKDHPLSRKSVFAAVGNEWESINKGVDSLVHQLKAYAPPSLRWDFKRYPEEDHNSVPLPGMYDGLRFLFSDWPVDVTDSTKVPTFDALKRHYESLSTEFCYTIMPPENVVELFGYELLYIRNKPAEAITVFKENVTNHPACFSAYQGPGKAYMKRGQYDLAKEIFERSIVLNPDNERGKEMLNRLRTTEK